MRERERIREKRRTNRPFTAECPPDTPGDRQIASIPSWPCLGRGHGHRACAYIVASACPWASAGSLPACSGYRLGGGGCAGLAADGGHAEPPAAHPPPRVAHWRWPARASIGARR